MRDTRDSMYRVMSYIARQGGPEIVGPVHDLANLKAHRSTMLTWLEAQQDIQELVENYAQHRERWSPVFED